MPDAELFDLAGAGRLSEPTVLAGQVDRMLDELAEAEAQAQAGIDAGEGADAGAAAVTLTR